MIEPNKLTQLPNGWVWTTLGEIITSIKGKKPSRFIAPDNPLAVPYINIEAFENKVFTHYTDETGLPMCEPNDVLIVWDGARFGLVGRGVSGVIGSTLAKLKAYGLDSSYLFYFLRAKFQYINQRPRGVGIPHVEPNLFWYIPFPLPPLPEQHRIFDKIEELFTRLDAGVEALNKIKLQLRRYHQAVLKSAFEGKLTAAWREAHKGELEPASMLLERIREERVKSGKHKELPPLDTSNLPKLPEGWAWTTIGTLFEVAVGGTPSRQKPEYWSGNIAWVSSGEVANCRIAGAREYITASGVQNSNAKPHTPGTVLLAMIGEGKTRGQAAILGIHAATNQNVASILCHDSIIPSQYVFLWLIARYKETRTKGSGDMQPALNSVRVRLLTIPLCPLPEQHQIVEEIDRRFSVAEEIEKVMEQSLIQSERLRQSILKRAFEGKLVPQDPGDESAERLLERIKAEKARQQVSDKATRGRNRRNQAQGRLV
jgi:type I restriction enzyme S subunit